MSSPNQPPSSSFVAPPNNWNPFSTRPGLDAPSFAVSVLCLSACEFTAGFLIQDPLHAAKLSLDFKQLATLYVVWAVACLVGFLMIANTFMKRWATIYQMETCPKWMKTLARILLLSPLLSIWATLYTLCFSKDGPLFKDGDRRSLIVGTAVGTLLMFHLVFSAGE